MDSQLPKTVFSSRTLAAFAVHVFTACGAACALLALIAAASADWTLMFLWLGVALIVDGVDGTFARHLHVAELLPRWSGDVLDFVVDYGTYVLVPAYAIATGGVLTPAAARARSGFSSRSSSVSRCCSGLLTSGDCARRSLSFTAMR